MHILAMIAMVGYAVAAAYFVTKDKYDRATFWLLVFVMNYIIFKL